MGGDCHPPCKACLSLEIQLNSKSPNPCTVFRQFNIRTARNNNLLAFAAVNNSLQNLPVCLTGHRRNCLFDKLIKRAIWFKNFVVGCNPWLCAHRQKQISDRSGENWINICVLTNYAIILHLSITKARNSKTNIVLKWRITKRNGK